MDLSNLSNTLPHSKPISRQKKPEESHPPSTSQSSTSSTSSSDISSELTTHFKDAAKAVASLYNSSLTSSSNESQKSAVKLDFASAARSVASLYKLGQISHSSSQEKGYLQCIDDLLDIITNNEDVENWALTRRAELTKNSSSTTIRQQKTTLEDSKIPSDFVFQFNSDTTASFKPSIPPISVQHNQSQRNPVLKKTKLQQQYYKKLYSSGESSESETDDNKRVKIFKDSSISPAKKKKKKN
ncbi:uncharacterized protein KGF55_003220 [Candida pseudojiufengensis]|uniref:uncharacterized protein n=1 Tax=Candida pseudojiufengensis TaxID=497109 RepID=UPI002225B4A5|nr:uncharacterized protein KGF55_003220 [Candida pseudojiufengensis]KAI5962144.1 hypothetical protein KGF55_003220 [Candida pseudojiufengensis]